MAEGFPSSCGIWIAESIYIQSIDSKMAAIKSQSKRSEDHMMETRKLARKSARLTKKKPEETGEKKDGDSEVPPSRENDCGNECEV